MRCYRIDDLLPEDLKRVTARMDELGWRGSMDGIWYMPLPDDMLEAEQREHLTECGPHILAVEAVDESTLQMELLVRARGKLRCSCVCYASPRQREAMIERLDSLIRELDIPV